MSHEQQIHSQKLTKLKYKKYLCCGNVKVNSKKDLKLKNLK